MHEPKLKRCPRGLYAASCSCGWLENVKHKDPAGALNYWASRHGAEVAASEER